MSADMCEDESVCGEKRVHEEERIFTSQEVYK